MWKWMDQVWHLQGAVCREQLASCYPGLVTEKKPSTQCVHVRDVTDIRTSGASRRRKRASIHARERKPRRRALPEQKRSDSCTERRTEGSVVGRSWFTLWPAILGQCRTQSGSSTQSGSIRVTHAGERARPVFSVLSSLSSFPPSLLPSPSFSFLLLPPPSSSFPVLPLPSSSFPFRPSFLPSFLA